MNEKSSYNDEDKSRDKFKWMELLLYVVTILIILDTADYDDVHNV